MHRFLPDMYKPNIFTIDYELLKQKNIKLLLFDLDNTLSPVNITVADQKTKELLESLTKHFWVVIISNNNRKRVSTYANNLEQVDYVHFSLKPLSRGFYQTMGKCEVNASQTAMIGDQLLTDIYGAKRLGIFTILVDPLANKDIYVTGLNRFCENIIIKKYTKKGLFKKGKYYD